MRELKNALQQAFILADTVLEAEHLPAPMAVMDQATPVQAETVSVAPTINGQSGDIALQVGDSLEDAERILLHATLVDCDGDKTRTAELLGVSVKTVYNMIKRHGPPAPP